MSHSEHSDSDREVPTAWGSTGDTPDEERGPTFAANRLRTERDDERRCGSRDNYYDSQSERWDDDLDRPGHVDHATLNKERWIASTLLRGHPEATIICARCFHRLESAVDLSEPCDYVAASRVVFDDRYDEDGDRDAALDLTDVREGGYELLSILYQAERYSDHRRHRYCPSCDHVAPGTLVQDFATNTFHEIVVDVLDAVDGGDKPLPPSTRDRLETEAMDRKRDGMSDVANIEILARDLSARRSNS